MREPNHEELVKAGMRCAGCGNPPRGSGCKIEIGVGVMVTICQGRTAYSPSLPCLDKARAPYNRCPACGVEGTKNAKEALCGACAKALVRGRQAQAGDAPTKRHRLNSRAAFGPYISSLDEPDGDALLDKLAVDLARVVSPRGVSPIAPGGGTLPNSEGWCPPHAPEVELNEAQLGALQSFLSGLAGVAEMQRRAGFRHGDSVLLRLARGEVTVDRYSEDAEKRR